MRKYIRDCYAVQILRRCIFSYLMHKYPRFNQGVTYEQWHIPFTITIPVMGIHSLEPSGKIDGLLRVGRASKCAWTSDAIRDGNDTIVPISDIACSEY